MTTYTTITNAEIDQDSPITQPLLTALRDNPIALAEGAAGAPGISILALEELEAGSTTRYNYGSIAFNSSATVFDIGFIQSGSIRISFEYRSTTGGNVGYDISVSTGGGSSNTTTNTSFISISEDINVSIGTIITFSSVSSVGFDGEIQNLIISTSGQRIFPVVLANTDFADYVFT